MLAVEVGADYVEQVFVQQALDLIFGDDISNPAGLVNGELNEDVITFPWQ